MITLKPKIRALDQVDILLEESDAFYNVENSNVIDYYPYDQLCFFAIKYKGDHYLELNSESKNIHSVKLNFNPTEFYLDIFGNFHLLSVDSAYQIWLSDTQLSWLKPIPLSDFNEQIRPIVGTAQKCVYSQKYELVNKYYTIKHIEKDTTFISYQSFDKVAYRVAKNQEYKIIAMYYAAVTPVQNVIENGIWDGDFVKLAEDFGLMQEVGWYEGVLSSPIRCEAFGMKEYIAVIDFFRDSVSVINPQSGALIQQSKIQGPASRATEVFYDYFFDIIYFIENTGKGLDIYTLNPIDGTSKLMKGIYGVPFVENIKISGDWVYFELRERSGFNKILRQKLR